MKNPKEFEKRFFCALTAFSLSIAGASAISHEHALWTCKNIINCEVSIFSALYVVFFGVLAIFSALHWIINLEGITDWDIDNYFERLQRGIEKK